MITKQEAKIPSQQDILSPSQQTTSPNSSFKISCKTVHQLDCIYHGEINKSYQRQGFGILQTIDFNMYFGFWKNNKAEGKGLLLNPSGTILIGYFSRNQLYGPVVFEDHDFIKVCTIEGQQQQGLAFEYTKANHVWRILKHTKDGTTVIQQERQSISQRLPDFLTVEHSLCSLLKDYLACDYFREIQLKKELKRGKPSAEEKTSFSFQDLSANLVGKEGDILWLGLKGQKGLQGLGCIYCRQTGHLTEAGCYHQGLLRGYAYQSTANKGYSITSFCEGIKDGLCFKVEPSNYTVLEFRDDKFTRTINMTDEQFKKKQKAYNYRQKNFLSAVNQFSFDSIPQILKQEGLPKIIHADSHQKSKQQEPDRYAHLRRTGSPVGMKAYQSNTKSNVPQKLRGNSSLISGEEVERPSLDILRLKMGDYHLERSQVQARGISQNRRQILLSRQLILQSMQVEEESIGQQQNPFDRAMLGINLIQESPPRKLH